MVKTTLVSHFNIWIYSNVFNQSPVDRHLIIQLIIQCISIIQYCKQFHKKKEPILQHVSKYFLWINS